MSKPELASVWHEHKTTSLPPSKKMKEKEDSFDIDSKLSLVDSEVERDPKDWEIKMRQLSRELSSILHRLKVSMKIFIMSKILIFSMYKQNFVLE